PASVQEPIFVASAGDTQVLGGGSSDPMFRDQAPEGGLLVGLDVQIGNPFNSVQLVTPVFRNARGEEVVGRQHGQQRQKAAGARAKEGYAVGGIIVKAGLLVDGLSIVFMRVKGDALDPSDSYESEWLGGMGGNAKTKLAGDGRAVIALIGRYKGTELMGIGLSTKE
ncbi:MAG: hypothetical protein B7Z73_11280, partial [Planctomycetia bacterium 21-64-5]